MKSKYPTTEEVVKNAGIAASNNHNKPLPKIYDHLVFICRAQPFHNGHRHVIDTALGLAHHVIVLVGSANAGRCLRNPFTFEERKQMIVNSLGDPNKTYDDTDPQDLSILPLNDYTYNDSDWITSVQHIVNEHVRSLHPCETYEQVIAVKNLKIGLIGHSKDHSSYYLKLFPTWGHVDVHGVYNHANQLVNSTDIRQDYFVDHPVISATDIRKSYFSGNVAWQSEWSDFLPNAVIEFLNIWTATQEYQKVIDEFAFVQDYKKQWSVAPYPVTFTTADAVVVQSGHVLMVRRGAQPGKGKLALPGGFLNQDETLLQCAIRELKEETGIKVPDAVLRGSVKREKTFDDPHRSARGRTLTTAFLIHLPLQTELPKVRGGDDAASAHWIALSDLKAYECFEDHWHIVNFMTSGL